VKSSRPLVAAKAAPGAPHSTSHPVGNEQQRHLHEFDFAFAGGMECGLAAAFSQHKSE